MTMINGVINVYKEKGYTSHDVVAKLRGITHQKKIGHTGTLDPQAEGVLLVCFGAATRICDQIEDWHKSYHAECRFGLCTDTQDLTGQVLETHEVTCSEEEIRDAAASFQGPYEQVPPMYSALKVGGKRLYELARQGKSVERKARCVCIDEIRVGSYDPDEHVAELDVTCSKGTYIRTLCEDLGKRLGCGAAMQSLVRTAVGSFTSDRAVKLDQIDEMFRRGELDSLLIPVDSLFPEMPAISVTERASRLLANGNPLAESDVVPGSAPEDGLRYRVYGSDGRFQAIYAWDAGRKLFYPHKMFLTD